MIKRLAFCILTIPNLGMAGALEDGAPLAKNYNLSAQVLLELSKHKRDELRPHPYQYKGETYSYYIDKLQFLGRGRTISGFRNLFAVLYIRSASYNSENRSPARGHQFILFVTDSGKIDHYERTDAEKIFLNGSVIEVDENKFDLNTEKGMEQFSAIVQ